MSLGWSLTEVAAHLLHHEEREVVLGDLSEAHESTWHGLLDVLGLVTRRQLQLWQNWRPWLSGFGLALPSSFLLMGASVGVSTAYQSLNGPRDIDQHLLFICQVLLLAAWSWSGGFVVGKLSRLTLWASVLLCLTPCLFCMVRFRIPSLSRASLLLFLLPAVVGALQGVRRIQISLKAGFALAVSVTALMVFMCSSGRLWFVNWSLIWPVWYIVSTAPHASREVERS
jgi:hypothetical protein